jgi:ribosomal protein S4
MVKVKGKISSPKRFKNYLYRKNLMDIYNTLLKERKYNRLHYQIFKNLEFTLFKRFLNGNISEELYPINNNNLMLLKYNKNWFKEPIIKKNSTLNNIYSKNFKFNILLNKFINNIHFFTSLKKNTLNSNIIFSFFKRLLEKRKGKLGYLNWKLFYADKPIYISNKPKDKGSWLFIPKSTYKRKSKKLSDQRDGTFGRVLSFYGFSNADRLRKLIFFSKYSHKLRRFTALNMEARVNILLYRLNLIVNVSIANKLIKRGMLKINGRICDSVYRSLKLHDNFSLNFKIYKFIINVFKKRLRNKKIWSAVPSFIEPNFVIMHFGVVAFPQVFDLLKFNNVPPFNLFNIDVINMGPRHFIINK